MKRFIGLGAALMMGVALGNESAYRFQGENLPTINQAPMKTEQKVNDVVVL